MEIADKRFLFGIRHMVVEPSQQNIVFFNGQRGMFDDIQQTESESEGLGQSGV